ncbi:replication initiation protein [Actinocrinis puniceicyclus]|uniref:Replication initiation protein n=1 Tax=Actinocrinis puniceicyclus TaxID=977794 RepID=A0A8J7WIT6_9ACTN|nr:replication initiator [Actinocrinis puniceicyclus]MBS2962103.1 replication initiation protein [Actinocrinis puniceicyclus]
MTDTLDLAALGFRSGDLGSLVRVVQAKDLLDRAGTCERPLRLVGGRDVIEATTGTLLDSTTDQQITVSCGNRRASVCGYCSTLYKFDAYNLVAAGLRGGKNTPAAVAAHPRLFVTVTAPSFGPVHLGPDKSGQLRPCKPRRDGSGCVRWHRADDPLIGTPLDPSTYDYQGHVLFNAMAGALWSATLTEIRRALARRLGLPRRRAEKLVRVNFAKVAEYQARGIVHFHAVARLDGPDGPLSPPPAWATAELLEQAIREGVARTSVEVPESKALGAPVLAWGEQIDVRAIAAGQFDHADDLTDVRVARYIAKYATKAAESAGVELPPMACRTCAGSGRVTLRTLDRPDALVPCSACSGIGRTLDLDQWNLTDHARRLIDTCWQLGAIRELEPLRLRKWAHMLGFRGHFATKSRTYSTTFGALRQERADHTARHDPLTAALAESPDVLVINHWSYAGPADASASSPIPRHMPDLEGAAP